MRILLLLLLLSNLAFSDDKREIYLYLEGRSVYQEMCAQCHGKLGKGDGDWAEGWTENRPRNFREGVFKFRSTPMGKLPTDADLRRTISSGISGTAMPAFKKHLSESQYDAVIEYIKHLSKRWRDPENQGEPVKVPEMPEWFGSVGESKRHSEAGRELFAKHCTACHGEAGKGDGVAGVALMDVWGHKIKPADLTVKFLKSGQSSADIYRSVAMGLDGTPMVGFKGILSDREIWDLIVFIRSLRGDR
ncbi:MAG: c-type cytochrome [Verrucomicrobiales bacterium]|nr:c-type cytochrome [Verrucomicrobiales bacterium]